MSQSESSIGQDQPSVPVRSIRTQMQRMVTLTTVIALAIAGFLIIAYQYVTYRRTILERTRALAEMIAVNSAAVLTSRDADAARELLRTCAQNPEILSARLYTTDDEIFAMYVRPGGVVAPFPLAVLRDGHVIEGSQLILRHPITVAGQVIGQVGVRAEMRAELQHLRNSIGLVLACMALAAVVAAVVVRRLLGEILTPVMDLADVAVKVAQTNDYSLRLPPTGWSEVEAVTATFNDMLVQIQQRDKEVSEAYDELTRTTSHLQVSEEQFRQLTENIREVFWLTSPDKSQMLYISPAYATVWGRSCESLLQEPLTWADAIHPEDRARVLAGLPAQVGGEYDVEYRIQRPDGGERWIHDRAFPIRDADGKVYRLAGLAEDVTEQKEMEIAMRCVNEVLEQRVQDRTAALQSSEERYRRIVVTAEEGIWTIDAAARTDFVNPKMAQMLGYTVEEMQGRHLHDFMDAEGRAIADNNLQRRQQGIAEQHEFKFQRKDGTAIWTLLATNPITDASGTYQGALAMITDITARKQAEEKIRQLNEVLEQRVRERTADLAAVNVALRVQQQEQQSILDSVPAFIWYKDCHNRILRVNRSAAQAIGKTVAEVEGRPTAEFYPDEAGLYYAADQEVIRSGQPKLGIVEPVTMASGEKRWVQTDKVPFRNDRGELSGIIVCATDITRLKQIEDQLRAAETKYRLLVERVPAVTYTAELGAGGRWHYVSPQIESLLGFTPAEWQADPHLWHRQVLPADRAHALLHDEVVRRTGQYDAEYRMLTRAGATIWVQDTGVFMDSAAGSPPLLQGVLLEITARKLAEQTVRESREQLQAILDNSPAVIFMKDTAGKYLLVNRQFELLIHKKMADVIGKTDFDLLPAATAEVFRKNDQRVLAEKQSLQFEEVAPHPQGLYTYVSVKFPIFDAAGEPVAVGGISTDISERQGLQRQLLEVSDREQRRIGRDLHDGLCQLLTGTAFAAKALEERLTAAGSAEVKDVAKILDLVQRANVQARNVARGLDPVDWQAGGLAASLRELVDSYQQIYGVECRLDCEADWELPDHAKAGQLYRIVQEAMTNAVKHGQAKQILVRLATNAGTLALSVADDGRGLTTAAPDRTGMGLNIMAYRARMVGGTLSVARREEGGTVVELVCPLE